MRYFHILTIIAAVLLSVRATSAQTPTPSPTPSVPSLAEWNDDFDGDQLNEKKWEKFSFQGANGGKLEIKKGELRLRGANETRAGVRSKDSFSGDRWLVEAKIAKVGVGTPPPGQNGSPLGFANLTIMFDSTGKNRVEWGLTSDGNFEAWSIVDGRAERLDNRKLGTKLKNPVISIGRRGDEFLFLLNSAEGKPQDAQIGLQTKIRNLPKSFHVMLYGFGSSENNWDSVRVVVPQETKK